MLYFTSDWHLGHYNILKYDNRPFSTINEHNETIVSNYNSIVKDDDTVYFLGDLGLNHKYIAYYGRLLKGNKILILGNHDAGFKRFDKFHQSYLDIGFQEICYEKTIQIGETVLKLSHFPYNNQDPRFIRYLPKDEGNWLIRGHSHSKPEDAINHELRMIDVGVQAWNYKPVSLEHILEIITVYNEIRRNE